MNRESANSRHRNNAAEWIMWVCLLPIFGLLVMVEKMKGNRGDAESRRER